MMTSEILVETRNPKAVANEDSSSLKDGRSMSDNDFKEVLAKLQLGIDQMMQQQSLHNEAQMKEQAKQTAIVARQHKHQVLGWALSQLKDLHSPHEFQCRFLDKKTKDVSSFPSSMIVRNILLSFMQDKGVVIDDRILKTSGKDEFSDSNKKVFCDKISGEINGLIGLKPVVRVLRNEMTIFCPDFS
uniref:Uncharacterized protein n=1 Tax=Corethron hystrix TaxID=216773 RepID=A0A7S1BUQ2_9STRA|mmetsp:Transcript_40602/g.95343  ORF Transcript_40602/g.95343 Transcript_40602/m.95343 type:complete len:187 (+) Transcript_40602:267-827(+)